MNEKIDKPVLTKKLLNFQSAAFVTSVADYDKLPQGEAAENNSVEIAFVGRSNAGKSSAINKITSQNNLAKTSKTPGRTQLINFFAINSGKTDSNYYLVDLPGYGFAKVPNKILANWQQLLSKYIEARENLSGIFLIVDVRHAFKDSDLQFIKWASFFQRKIHVLLTKSDKLTRNHANQALASAKKQIKQLAIENIQCSMQLFSATNNVGLEQAKEVLSTWFTAD